jgi:hypothetical protein
MLRAMPEKECDHKWSAGVRVYDRVGEEEEDGEIAVTVTCSVCGVRPRFGTSLRLRKGGREAVIPISFRQPTELRCDECRAVLGVHGFALEELAEIECGPDHVATLRDGTEHTIDAFGIRGRENFEALRSRMTPERRAKNAAAAAALEKIDED